MLLPTEREKYLLDKLHNDKTLTEEEKDEIRKELIKICEEKKIRNTIFTI
jgi:hypothetical protein